MSATLDKFGKLIVKNLRDKPIDNFKGLLQGKWRDDHSRELQKKLSKFTSDDKRVIADVLEDVLETAMHDLLHAIQMGNDIDGDIIVLMDNENVAELSDGLHGEIFGEEGWIHRFSKHKSFAANDKTNWIKKLFNKN